MKKLIERLKRTAKKGQSLVEYGLILALVAVIAIAALQVLGSKITNSATTAGDAVQNSTANAGETYCTSINGTWDATKQTCTPQ